MKKSNKLLILALVLSMIFSLIGVLGLTASAADVYTLVTDVSNLSVGDQVVIVAKDYDYALSTTQKSNNRGQAAVTKSNGITIGSDVQVLTLEGGTIDGTFAFNTGSGYLYAASSSNNYLRTETTLSANSSWSISIATDGTATVVAQGSNTRNTMQYNANSSLFACYASASQKAICIYKLETSGGNSDCTHTYDEGVVTAPTCTAAGCTTYTCTACGGYYTENEVAALGHSYVDYVCETCGADDPDHYFVMSIADALAAADGKKVEVSGTVCAINTAWSDSYGNISVTITDADGNELYIYRLKTNVALGDIITVQGTMATYNSSRQIAAGATATIDGHDDSYDYTEMTIPEAIQAEDNTNVIVIGTVVEINTEYSESFGNISVTIADEAGNTLYLYRLSGNVALHENITVKGTMATYNESRQVSGGTFTSNGIEECSEYTDATCTEAAKCVICGATNGGALGHSYVEGVCSICSAADPDYVAGPTEIDLSEGSYTITEEGEYVVLAYEGENTLTIQANATVTLQGVKITAGADASAISIESGNVTLIVDGENTLLGGDNGAGIYVAEGASLTVKDTDSSDDKLIATGNAGVDDASGAAGIGGTWANGNSGAITVDGATVVASGYGVHGSGIGSGSGKVVGAISIINGANVTAYGGYYADGAGTKLQSDYGKTDPEGGAAIGGGGKTASTIAAITITDSTVTAYGGSKAAGIGANFWSSCSNITIGGSSNVTAYGGSSSAAIGTSRAGDGVSANITISGGQVTAVGGDYGAAIGGGYNADSVKTLPTISVSISGGTVNATGGMGGAAIGGGYKTNNLDIEISGGDVTAVAGDLVSGKTVENGGAPSAIGSGANGSGTFNGSEVTISESATLAVTSYEDGKAAIENTANEDLGSNVTFTEIANPNKVYAAQIGETKYETLAKAIEAAQAGDTVILLADVDLDQMPTINKAITLKGADNTIEVNCAIAENFPGIDGTVTFENIIFNERISTENASNDQSKMTLKFVGCTFNVPAGNTYAIQGGASWNNDVLGALVVEDCIFNTTAASYVKGYMVYAQCVESVTITGSTFDGGNVFRGAMHLGDSTEYATVATVSGNTIKNFARGVQVANRVEGSTVTIDGNTFENIAAIDGESESATVYIHEVANVNTTSVEYTNNEVGNALVVFSENATGPVPGFVSTFSGNTAGGVAIELEGNYKDTAYVAPDIQVGYLSTGYINGVGAFFGEAINVVATDSFVVKLYSGETLIGTATLVDNDKVLLNGQSKSITWHAALADDGDSWWSTTWNQTLNVNNIPDRIELWLDGEKVSDGLIELNINDLEKPVFAAITDANGNILSFVAGTGYLNGTGANAPSYDAALQSAIKVAAPAGTLVLLDDVSVDEWVMFAESLTIGDGSIVTLAINGLTIDGNGHTLTINSVESAGNGGYLFYDAQELNVKDLTITYADGVNGGICLKSGTIENVTFNGGMGVLPGANGVTITGCTFNTTNDAIYYDDAREGIVITGNTFNVAKDANVVILRSNEQFTNNIINSGRTVNIATSSSATVTGNDFNDVRLKVYNAATATVSENTINNLVFNDATVTKTVFADNTLSESAQAALDAVLGLKGSGTEEDPYLINNIKDLIWFRDSVNTYTSDGSNQYKGKYVKLTADIDLAGINWTPIGTNSVGDHMAFLGTFDGDGHTISNLYINADGDHLGFFARVGSYAEDCTPVVKNITFNNVDVSTNSTDHWDTVHGDYVGGVIANAGGNSVISNVKVTGDVYVVGCGYVGGIVGHGYPDIDNCHVIANDGSYARCYYWCVGGIIGYAGEDGTPITNCSVSGLDIWSAYGGAAAVAGLLNEGNKLENVSASNVSITSNSDYVMGYVAGNGEESTLTNVTITNVTATANGNAITVTDAVASVGDAIYFDLQSAIDAAAAGETVTLLRDVTEAGPFKVTDGDDITVKGNNYTIYCEDGFYVTGGKLTLCDDLSVVASVYNAVYLRGGEVITSANLKTTGTWAVIQGNGSYVGDVTINGGIIETTADNNAIFWPQNGKLTINGGTITGGSAVALKSGSLEINGGTLNGIGEKKDYEWKDSGVIGTGAAVYIETVGGNTGYEPVSSVSITGGTFVSTYASAVESYAATSKNPEAVAVTGFISGGTFSSAVPEEYCADGYVPKDNGDGTYGVVGYWYDSTRTEYHITCEADLWAFAEAANAGNNFSGKTVYLDADIDLGGKAWTPIASFAGNFVGGNHTISNFSITATSKYSGFFGEIASSNGLEDVRVKDLILSDITAFVGNVRFGTLAGSVDGVVHNVTVKNITITTTHSDAWVGGMTAWMYWPWMTNCTVENMTVDATAGAEFVSGFACILQKNSNHVFDNLDVNGFKVTVSDTDGSCGVAGFVGQTQRGWENPKVINCDITGIDVVATGTVDVAGFIAWPGAHTIAENCTTEGKIDVTGVTSSICFAGGFFGNAGWNDDLGQMGHVLTDCSADVDIITKVADAGGFIGQSDNSSAGGTMYITYNNCSASGDITCVEGGTADIGGFFGSADRGVFNDCSASGTVTNNGTGKDGQFGGIMLLANLKDSDYDYRYPAGTRDYMVDEIALNNCTATGTATSGMFIGEIEEGVDVTFKNYVAQIGENKYYSLAEALEAAADGDTVILLGNITLDSILVLDKAITIDGAGFTLTSNATRAINVNCNGAVGIKNLTIVNGANVERAINVIDKAATLTVDNVVAEGFKYTVNVAASSIGSSITINGGKFSGYAAINLTGSNTTVVVNDAELVGVNDATLHEANNFAVIAIGSGATCSNLSVTVNGGKITATSANGNKQYIVSCNGATNSYAYIDAELTLVDGEVLSADADDITCYFRADYADELAARGYVTKSAFDGMVSVSGSVPYYIGANGNWFFNGEDTGYKAVGTDGNSFTIGEDGYWYLNGEKTEYKAVATDADQYTIGEDGYWYLNGTKTKYKALGQDGNNYTIGDDGYWYLNGEKTENKAIGTDGDKVEIRDDGYWYINGVKTEYKAVGEDGKTPSFKIENGNLWASFDNIKWTDLGQVVGQDGAPGTDGKTPTLKVEDGHLWVSYDDGATWKDLGNVTGADGSDGSDGTNGLNGKTPIFQIVEGVLQVSYDNGATWADVGNVAGENGSAGVDGKTPTFQIVEGVLQVSYDNGNTWTSLGQVVGANGEVPTISENGNWVIGGVETNYPAIGKDGKNYTIGADGYWYLDGEKTEYRAIGVDGKTPTFKIDAGNLFVSYDDGATWTDLGRVVGQDGITPHIGENGHWWIGETDTGVPAKGQDGKAPFIGENGHWWIGETDTGISAQAQDNGDMKEIVVLCIIMAILCVITILVAVITRKSRYRWWILT